MMRIPDRYRTPWQLCRAVEETFPADAGRLVRRPFNHYDPDYTNWYLVPSLTLPFFKFGKYYFSWDEKVRQEIRMGLIVTKGLDPSLQAAYPTKRGKRLLMDDSWAWLHLLEGMRSGALMQAIRETAEQTGEDVLIEISCGYIDDPGLFDPDQDYQTSRYSYQNGYDAAKRLLAQERKFTALFASADVMAVGAIRAFRDCGLQVPEDVSVMGFDGLQVSSFLLPRLSTVCQNAQLLAQRSLEILLENIETPQPPRYETIPVTVALRESIQTV